MNGLQMRRSELMRTDDVTNLIVQISRLFGKEGTPYDFKNINIQEARDKCVDLEHQMKGMKKSINKAVLGMLEVWGPFLCPLSCQESL
jgi:hypothetical protein